MGRILKSMRAVVGVLGIVLPVSAGAAPIVSTVTPESPWERQWNPAAAPDPELEARTSELQRRRALRPDDPLVAHELGRALWHMGKRDEAMALWLQAEAASPNVPPAALRKQVEEIFSALALNDRELAGELLAAAQEAFGGNPHFLVIRAEQALQSGRSDLAATYLEQAREAAPGLYVTSLALGRLAVRQGDGDAAERHLARATSLGPGCAVCWYEFGAVQAGAGQEEAGAAALAKAHVLDPDAYAAADVSLARLLERRDDLVGARFWYLRGLARDEAGSVGVRLALAGVLMRLNLPGEARTHLDQVLTQNDSPPVLALLASAMEADGDAAAAEKLYRQALARMPGYPVAANNLAMLLLRRQGDPQEIMRLAETAIQADPDDADLLGTFACAAGGVRRENAEPLLARAVRLAPSDPWLRWCYGAYLAEGGSPEKARIHLNGVLLLDPAFPLRAEVEAALRRVSGGG